MPVDRTPSLAPEPLPFGNASALEFTDEATCGEFLARLPDAPSRFGAIGPTGRFHVRLRNVSLPGVSLVAGASSPKATDHLSRRMAIVIPFAGSKTILRSGRRTFHWAAPHHAFFIPPGQQIEADSNAGSFLRLDIEQSAIERITAGMVADEPTMKSALALEESRIVTMHHATGDWLPTIRALCATIDACDCDATRLIAAGFDDVLLRTAAMMLHPFGRLEPRWGGRPTREFDLAPLLERITAGLGGPITLGDLETWSGYSARAIQLAFQKRFGVRPMEWVRDRRLDLVRAKLLAASSGTTVREVAAACGIPRMATLVPEYLARFGERPSDTLRRRHR